MKTETEVKPQHTPTPWKVIGREEVWGSNEKLIADMSHSAYGDGEAIEANAAFIVKAVNNFGPMLNALQELDDLMVDLVAHMDKDHFYHDRIVEASITARHAIAKAEGL